MSKFNFIKVGLVIIIAIIFAYLSFGVYLAFNEYSQAKKPWDKCLNNPAHVIEIASNGRYCEEPFYYQGNLTHSVIDQPQFKIFDVIFGPILALSFRGGFNVPIGF